MIDSNLQSGSKIYIVYRSADGRVLDVLPQMLLGTINGYAIANFPERMGHAARYSLKNAEAALEYSARQTREKGVTSLKVYPLSDCYLSSKEAEAAYIEELDRERGRF